MSGYRSLLLRSRQINVALSIIIVTAVVVVSGFVAVRLSHAASLVGDLNGDGSVNIFDLSILLSDWGTGNVTADLNGDGTVNIFDLSILLSHWGQTASLLPSPSASPSNCPSSGATFSSCGMPDATDTGVPAGTTLTNEPGMTITTAGTVINGAHITGIVDVEADNVTIENSEITGTTGSWWGIKYGATDTSATGLKVLHVTVDSQASKGPDNGGYDYGIAPIYTSGSLEIGYSNISGFKDGIDVNTGNLHDNYIHDLSSFSGAHTQCIYVWSGGSGVAINHNTIINQTSIAYASAAVYIAPDSGHDNDITVSSNWLAGGASAVYGGDTTATDIRVLNNYFSTEIFPNSGYYGTDAYWWGSNTGNTWSGNVWANGPNAGQTIAP